MSTIAFFNNKGGVGKTTLVYHLAWMYAELGLRVVAADLDPQAKLTAMFLDEERLELLWPDNEHTQTLYGTLQPLFAGTGDIHAPSLEPVTDSIALLAGDLALSQFEDELNSQWPRCLDRQERAFRVISAFWRTLVRAAEQHRADVTLIDVGPNLGAINRAALIAARHLVIPLAPDIYSLQGLKNLGPTVRRWREEWAERKARNPVAGLALPPGELTPAGYVILQHAVRLDRPVQAYERWIQRIPEVYRHAVLGEEQPAELPEPLDDPHRLAMLKHYRSLMPLAQEAHKPMFSLRPADGAIGGHVTMVAACYQDFATLARRIAAVCDLPLVRQ